MPRQSRRTKLIVYTGVMSALAIILFFIEFPVIPGLDYLMIDASDLPAAIAGIVAGPACAAAVELVKVIVHLAVKGIGSTMGFGDLVNFIVGAALTVSFSAVWRFFAGKGTGKYLSALFAGIAGIVCMTLAGIAANYFIAPPYFEFFVHIKLSGAALWAAIGGATVLNLIKSALMAVVMIPVAGVISKKKIRI